MKRILTVLLLLASSTALAQSNNPHLARVTFEYDPDLDGYYQVRYTFYDNEQYWRTPRLGRMRIRLDQINVEPDTTFYSEAYVETNFRFRLPEQGSVGLHLFNAFSEGYGNPTTIFDNGVTWETDDKIWIVVDKPPLGETQ